ncbi:MAG: YraN family protein [Rhodocyclaceae bacterium]|jgi:putative endonuclease|nr:YraN family protein [Rhodocyclaceae bacterium]
MSLIGRILRRDALTRKRGADAEQLAADYLARRGLHIEARNFRVRGGEIDLVCIEGGTRVFVEVRLRSNADFGGAAASITAAKRRRIVLAARHYLAQHGDSNCRFDCVLLDALDARRIEWIRDAFAAD